MEHKFGRLKPHPVEFESFEQKRMQYLEMVVKGPHFSERVGCTFEELINHEELTTNLQGKGQLLIFYRKIKSSEKSFVVKVYLLH